MAITPSTYEGPLHPTAREYPGFLKFLSHSYGFQDPRWFENDASYFFGARPRQLGTKWALKSGGQFAAHVGVFPFKALVEGRSLKVAGIGAVATHPDHRGKGLMKRLMEHALKRIEGEGYDLAILWGERDLYAPYGFERALYQRHFTFREKILRFFAAPHAVRPARPGDGPRIRALFQSHPYRVERSPDHFASVARKFATPGHPSVWVLESKGQVTAYAMVLRPPAGGLEIPEWGGPWEEVACLWASLFAKTRTDTLNVTLFPGDGLFGWALENASDQVMATRSCMVRVFDIGKVLKTFEPQLKRRYAALGVHARRKWVLASGGKGVALEMGKGLKVTRAQGPGITLSSGEWTGLLFGSGKPGREIKALGPDGALWDLLFPLEWYWWRSDWI
jgi:GNAT superfamily N-acetyltransferase